MLVHSYNSVWWLLISASCWLALFVNGDENGTATEAPVADDGSSEDAKYQDLWVAHGLMMGITFAVLLPIGIGCSILRHLVPGNGHWFRLHMFINGTAFLLMTAAFGIAVYVTEQLGDDHFRVSDTNHKAVGLAVYVLSFVQTMAGVFRPHLPVRKHLDASGNEKKVSRADEEEDFPDEGADRSAPTDEAPLEKSLARKVFEIGHRLTGFIILGMAWYNCYIGIEIMEEDYGDAYNKTAVLWGLVGALGGSILILYVYQTISAKMKS